MGRATRFPGPFRLAILGLWLLAVLPSGLRAQDTIRTFNAGLSVGTGGAHAQCFPLVELSWKMNSLRGIWSPAFLSLGFSQGVIQLPVGKTELRMMILTSFNYSRYSNDYSFRPFPDFYHKKERWSILGGGRLYFGQRFHASAQIGLYYWRYRKENNNLGRDIFFGSESGIGPYGEISLGISLWRTFR